MTTKLDLDNGWQEVVCVVSDINRIADDLKTVGNWHTIQEGPISQTQLKIWNLSNEATGHFKLVRNPNSTKGYIRFVQLDNVEQKQIRPAGQIWESGGIFDLNFRVTDINLKFEQLLNRGWTAFNEPAQYQFGPVVVSEVLMVGPDGIVFALIERIAPPLEEKGNPEEIGRSFNSSLVVKDKEKNCTFFTDILGFKPAMEVLDHNLPPGPNVLGLPHNIAPNHAMNVYIYHPNGVTDGSVEFLKLDNIEGRDFSKNAMPHNLGITSLRFPVSNIEEIINGLKAKETPLVYEPEIVEIAPYGNVKIFALELPEGGWLEFFETID